MNNLLYSFMRGLKSLLLKKLKMEVSQNDFKDRCAISNIMHGIHGLAH